MKRPQAVIGMVAAAAFGAAAFGAGDGETVRTLEERIADLEAKVEALEAVKPAPTLYHTPGSPLFLPNDGTQPYPPSGTTPDGRGSYYLIDGGELTIKNAQ